MAGLRSAGAHGHQHVWRLRGHAAHAGHVPQITTRNDKNKEETRAMSQSLATVAYLGAAILFILSLGGLS
ncbi:MAG: hypothetical protein EOO29_40010, partial [Comamonadaceae bacterium]